MVEGTPLLREHAVMSCIEGSNPSASANYQTNTGPSASFFVFTHQKTPQSSVMCMG